jgi:hypothetical protein
MKEETIQYQLTQPKIKLTKGQRDNYGWEISLPKHESQNNEDWIKELMHLDELMREEIKNLTKLEEVK